MAALAPLWLELGIPRDALGPDQREKVQVIALATYGMQVVSLLAAFQAWVVEKHDVVLYLAVAVAAAFANLRFLRATRRPVVCGHFAVAILAFLLVASLTHDGGFYDPSLAWLYVLPLAASVTTGMRGAFCWMLVTIAIVTGFWLLPKAGVHLADQTPAALKELDALADRLLTVVSLGALALSFGIAQRRTASEFLRETAYRQLVMHAAVTANEARSFDEAAKDAVSKICDAMAWEMGHVWQVGDDGTSRPREAAVVAPREVGRLEELIRSVEFPIGEGLPGRAVALRTPQIVTGIRALSLGERGRVAVELGIESAIAVPVLVHDRVRAVLEFATSAPLSDTDQLLGVMSHIAVQLGRVAERTAMQDRVQQAQKMEAVGQLAAGLAHEINNPMAYVRSNLYSLREIHVARKADGPVSAEEQAEWDDCQDLIDESLDGVERTISIVRDVTRFSRASGPDPSSWELACIDSLLRDALRVVGSRAASGVHIDIDSRPLPPTRCAPNPLRQVFMNLIMNALQAIGSKGWIGLSTFVDVDQVVIRVEDDGPGLRRQDRDRLFDPFFTTKPVGEGTGLGLTVSYEIVRSHGGEIRVESEPGEGAVFEVRLPVVSEDAAEAAQSAT